MMNLHSYIQSKKTALHSQIPVRVLCQACLQPTSWCYCHKIEPFECGIKFVILLHPLERRRRIATGRMSHLILKSSEIIHGHTFENDPRVNQLLQDQSFFPVVLHLDQDAIHLDQLNHEQKQNLCAPHKKLLIFVVDGTWGTAAKTVRNSKNLAGLPKVAFTPAIPSIFRVRQQPNRYCHSTIEALHQTIEFLGRSQGYDLESRKHDQLIRIFDEFVSMQVQCIEEVKKKFGTLQYRKKK